MKSRVKINQEKEKRTDFKGFFKNFFGNQELEMATPEEVILSDADLSEKDKKELIAALKRCNRDDFVEDVKTAGTSRGRTILGTSKSTKIKSGIVPKRESIDRERE